MKKGTKETLQHVLFVAFAILLLVQGGLALENGEIWQSIGIIITSFYMMIFSHAAMIAKIISIKLEEERDREKKKKNTMKKENIRMFIFLFFLCIAILLPTLGGIALENGHKLGISLIMLSLYIMMFIHTAIVVNRINPKSKEEKEINEQELKNY